MRLSAVCAFLVAASVTWGLTAASESLVPAADLRAAAARGLTPLVATAQSWPNKRKCFSCHHQELTIQAMAAARDHGVPFDASAAQDAVRRGLSMLLDLDRAVQQTRQIDPALDNGSMLLTAAWAGIPANGATTAYARLIAARQKPDGHWITIDDRPPQSWSEVTATAVAAAAVAKYMPDTRRAGTRRASGPRTPVVVAGHAARHRGSCGAHLRFAVERRESGGVAPAGSGARQPAAIGWRLGTDPDSQERCLRDRRITHGLASRWCRRLADPVYQRGLRYLLTTQQGMGPGTSRRGCTSPTS